MSFEERLAAWVLALVGVAVICMMGSAAIEARRDAPKQSVPAKEFDASVWRATRVSATRGSDRQLMVGDLLERHGLRGWSAERIVSLLGQPDERGLDDGYEMGYMLGGRRSGFPFQVEWLAIDLNVASQAVRVAVVLD